MKKIYLFTFLIFSVLTTSLAQDSKQFSTRFSGFRYSLYKDFESVTHEEMVTMNFQPDSRIFSRISAFLSDEKMNIIAYRDTMLSHFGQTPHDLSKYVSHEGFKADYEGFTFHDPDSILMEYVSIEPVAAIQYIISKTVYKYEGAESLSLFAFKNSFAAPYITAVCIEPHKWDVVVDYYTRVFKISFDSMTGYAVLKDYLVPQE